MERENIRAVGVDLSKHLMHVHAVNHAGRLVVRRKLSREGFLPFARELPKGTVVYMEACSGAHYWSRALVALGLEARQIPAQHVKPFVKSQKNDYHDAEAIVEAGLRPNTRFVSTKSVEQLELQADIRVRRRLVAERTALINEIRGLLAEHGIVVQKTVAACRRYLSESLTTEARLSSRSQALFQELHSELLALDERIERTEQRLQGQLAEMPVVKRLLSIPGIGAITAASLVAACGNGSQYKNGRHLAASLGLVPRQFSTGGRTTLGRITKRGDSDLRCLLIHGARSIVRYAEKKTDPHSLWVKALRASKGVNRTAVAVANKNARIVFRILRNQDAWFSAESAHAARNTEAA